jgi:hypothetical protein
MSKLVQEIRHFVLQPAAAGASHHDIAEEAMRLAKGGHIVSLELPGGTAVVTPAHTHDEAVAIVGDVMPKVKADKPTKGN